MIEFQSFGLLDKFPLAVEAVRECLARLRPEYHICLWVRLTVPRRKPTKAEKALQEKFDREYEEAEFERSQRERQEYLERLHRYELKKQQEGAKLDPQEFAPGERQPLPAAPWDREDEDNKEDDADAEADGDIAVKEKPNPPPSPYDENDHPLANNYDLMAHFTLTECYVPSHHRGVAEYLLRRPCDEVIEEKKEN